MSDSREEFKKLALANHGKFHGPNIEHLSISEENFYKMMQAATSQQAERIDQQDEIIAELVEALNDTKVSLEEGFESDSFLEFDHSKADKYLVAKINALLAKVKGIKSE